MDEILKKICEEEKELRLKIIKLESFLQKEMLTKIDTVQCSLLQIQLRAMKTYDQCLSERIIHLSNSIPEKD